MKAYKLMKVRKNGTLGPLFIGARNVIPEDGTWLESECLPTKGFAVRQGWHACFTPVAPHLSSTPKNGKRVWVEIEVEGVRTYDRPESQGGRWILAEKMRVTKRLDSLQLV